MSPYILECGHCQVPKGNLPAHREGASRAKPKFANRPLPAFTIEVRFLGGHKLPMRVTATSTVLTLCERVSQHQNLDFELVKLCDETRILDETEKLRKLAGKTLTAIISKPPLSPSAVELLKRCGGSGEEEHMEKFEMTFSPVVQDMATIAELLQWYQPCRLVTGKPPHERRHSKRSETEVCSIATVGDHLRCKLVNLKSMQLHPVTAADIGHVKRLLGWCPALQLCDLTENGLAAEHVAPLREAFSAKVII